MARTQAKKETTANKETTPAPTIKIANPRCPKCGCTELAKLPGDAHKTRTLKERDIVGMGPDGGPYNHVTWKRVKCAKCGQARVQIEYELRHAAAKKAKAGKKTA